MEKIGFYNNITHPVTVMSTQKEFLFEAKIGFIEWPSRSPDLNPIENLWVMLALIVYMIFRQFEDRYSLKKAILHVWDDIELKKLKALVRSMPRRCISVTEKRGVPTKY